MILMKTFIGLSALLSLRQASRLSRLGFGYGTVPSRNGFFPLIFQSTRLLPQNYTGWSLIAIGSGTITLLKANSSTAMTQRIQIVGAIGIFYNAPQYETLAPLKVENNAQALALKAYFRIFGQ